MAAKKTTVTKEQQSKIETSIWAKLSILFAILLPPIGLAFGIVALVKINNDKNLKGRGLAITGIVLSIVLPIIYFIIIAIIVASFLSSIFMANPELLLPDGCRFESPINCVKYSLTADGTLTVDLLNPTIDMEKVTLVAGENVCTPQDYKWQVGTTNTFTCKVEEGSIGTRLIQMLDLTYVDAKTGNSNSVTGGIAASYE
jgi:hypothetical protein